MPHGRVRKHKAAHYLRLARRLQHGEPAAADEEPAVGADGQPATREEKDRSKINRAVLDLLAGTVDRPRMRRRCPNRFVT